ncbi:MAG: response regulator [Alkalispirochaetaceae bacterium]
MLSVSADPPLAASKPRILLVEDQRIIALATAQGMRKQGYEVALAGSGEEALKLAGCGEDEEEAGFDLILMDVDLGSGMDGVEASQRILSEREIPIVFLTNHSDPDTVGRVREVSRYGYVLKSSGELQLQLAVEAALDLFNAHKRIGEREEELEAIYESVPVSLLLVTPEMRVVRANREARRTAGTMFPQLTNPLVGAVIRCVQALDDPEACGSTPHCESCPVRTAVRSSLESGSSHPRIEALLPVEREGAIREVRCVMSITPLGPRSEPRVLVAILEARDEYQRA